MKKNEKLLEALGEVDDEHIPDDEEKKKRSFIKWVPAAAGICAAAAVCVFALNALNNGSMAEIPPADTTTAGSAEITSQAPVSETGITTAPPVTDVQPTVPEGEEISYERVRKSSPISDITADHVLDGGVAVNTSFTVRSNADLPADELSKMLSISPETDFTLEKTGEFLYKLSAELDFNKGSVVKLAAESEEGGKSGSWAFQIIDDFRIKSVYPENGAEYVHVDSGIEITFSEAVDVGSAKEHFSIKPDIEGKFSTHGNTLYFIPKTNMEGNTRYFVTVSEGLKAKSGNTLMEGRDFSFNTAVSEGGFFIHGGKSETFIEGDPIVVEVRNYGSGTDSLEKAAGTKLYKYGSADDFMNDLSLFSDSEKRIETDEGRMTEIFSSYEKPVKGFGMYNPHFVMLPYDLEEGYYIANVTIDGLTRQHFFLVNPVSVYSMSLGDNTLFFVNDTTTGKPAAGAKVVLHTAEGDLTASADADGVARIYTGSGCCRSDMLEIVFGEHRYIDSLMNYSPYKATYSDMYYSYIYSDREAYQTSDTVNVWGVIVPRRNGVSLPDDLLLSFGIEDTDGVAQKVEVSENGTFSASFSYVDRESDWWGVTVSLLDGGNDNAVIQRKHLRVLDYVKPTYTFSIEAPEYLIMPQKEAFDAKLTATYYDGTPAGGLSFEADDRYSIVSGEAKTDDTGTAELKLKYKLGSSGISWRPSFMAAGFTLSGVENQYQIAHSNVFAVFLRDVMLENSYDRETGKYTVKTNRMDFSKIPEYLESRQKYRTYDDYGYNYVSYYNTGQGDYGILRGEPYDTSVSISIDCTWYERRETTEYDYLEKRNVTRYEYEYNSENLGTFTVDTKDGVGVFEDLPINDDGRSYHFNIIYKDSLGHNVTERDYWQGSSVYYGRTDYRTFSLESSGSFRENESVDFTLKEFYGTGNGREVQGRVLFVPYQNDIIDAIVYDSTEFSYKTDNRCTPNFRFCGAYFDGRHVYPIPSSMMKFDPSERRITLDVQADKEKYDAGEEVTLTVYARYEDGKPADGVPVSLSVVDEAAFSVAPQNVDILEDMYFYVYYPVASQKCSYVQHVMNGEMLGEKGGGGDGSNIRKDFRDNPYFGEEITDGGGKAVFRFKHADSITTWRATLQAAGAKNGRMYAGDRLYPIIATRPVFISPIMLPEYVEGDDITVTAKCVGINADDKISVTLEGGGRDKTLEILSCETANFGKLPTGGYTVTFRADNGVNSDAVQLPLSVADTRQEVKVRKDVSVAELSGIEPTKWPVSVTFFDKEYLFCKTLLQMLSFYSGERTDMRLVSDFAENELGWYENDYAAKVQSATGGGLARVLPNSEKDIKLTALLCAAFPESVSREAVESALLDKLKKCTYSDLSRCYMGLAALGKPVLEDIKRVLYEEADALTLSDKLYLTAGLALGGDFSAAYDSYLKLTADMKFYSGSDKPYAYFNDEETTRLALITASVMDLPEADALARGLIRNKPKYDSYVLELVVYIRNYVPKTEGSAAFSYVLDGKRTRVELDRYGRYTKLFDKERFEKADFRQESGDVLVYACYTGRISEIDKEPDIKVTKTYSKTSAWLVGDVITVTISAEPGCIIEDVIPSCARLYENNGSCSELGGQRVRLYTGVLSSSVTYKIRVNTNGSFVSEPAYARNTDGWGISQKGTVKVNEKVDT